MFTMLSTIKKLTKFMTFHPPGTKTIDYNHSLSETSKIFPKSEGFIVGHLTNAGTAHLSSSKMSNIHVKKITIM